METGRQAEALAITYKLAQRLFSAARKSACARDSDNANSLEAARLMFGIDPSECARITSSPEWEALTDDVDSKDCTGSFDAYAALGDIGAARWESHEEFQACLHLTLTRLLDRESFARRSLEIRRSIAAAEALAREMDPGDSEYSRLLLDVRDANQLAIDRQNEAIRSAQKFTDRIGRPSEGGG